MYHLINNINNWVFPCVSYCPGVVYTGSPTWRGDIVHFISCVCTFPSMTYVRMSAVKKGLTTNN